MDQRALATRTPKRYINGLEGLAPRKGPWRSGFSLDKPGFGLRHTDNRSPEFQGFPMGSFSLMHWMIVLLIVLLLFGAGKLPRVMGDFAKGIKAFKSGMKEEDDEAVAPPPKQQVPPPSSTASAEHVAHDRG
jgi:sec-independent protein translocase protein TatA